MEGIYFFGEYQRWNLGWSNPNQAGAFVAMWIPWFWAIGGWAAGGEHSGARRFWHGLRRDAAVALVLAVELNLWFLLCKTYSRGALVAAVGSGVVFIAWRHVIGRETRQWRWLAARVAGVLLLLAITGFFSRIDPRFVSQDASAGNRLTLWTGGLQMIAASPWHGWGEGNSGPAFMHWFQALDANEAYAGMVNSYLHVGVERGLPVLTAVITVALGILILAWHTSMRLGGTACGFVAAAGCSWLVFLLANGFSTLWIFGNLWWLPGGAGLWILGAAIAVRRGKVFMLAGKVLALAAVLSVVVSGGLWLAGRMMMPALRIAPGHGDGWVFCDGAGKPAQEALFFPDSSVLGETWGKEIRRLASESESLRLRLPTGGRSGGIPPDTDFRPRWIIACGREAGEGFAALGKFPEAGLILVHPLDRPAVPDGLHGKVSVILPMLDTRGTGRQWKVTCRKRGWECRTSPGVGQDVRLVWPKILLGEPGLQ